MNVPLLTLQDFKPLLERSGEKRFSSRAASGPVRLGPSEWAGSGDGPWHRAHVGCPPAPAGPCAGHCVLPAFRAVHLDGFGLYIRGEEEGLRRG